jgi:hypothetical protein
VGDREAGGVTDMVVSNPKLGQALAAALGAKPVALMRGHGDVVVGADVWIAVARAVYADENARMQAVALSLGGPVNYISAEGAQIEKKDQGRARAWELWKTLALKKARSALRAQLKAAPGRDPQNRISRAAVGGRSSTLLAVGVLPRLGLRLPGSKG